MLLFSEDITHFNLNEVNMGVTCL